MLKIFNPKEIEAKSFPINGGIAFIAKDNEIITMANEPILKTMEDIKLPEMKFLDVEVYFLPKVYRQYVKGMFNENAISGRAGMGWVAVSPLTPSWTDIDYNYLIWHELGHVFHVQVLEFFQRTGMSDKFKHYMELRGIADWGWGAEYQHELRAEEVFADDFAYLIGNVAKVNSHGKLSLPDQAIEDYIRSFIKPEEKEELDMFFKDVDEKRWSYEAIKYCIDNGILSGMKNTQTGEVLFRPDLPMTREQYAQAEYNKYLRSIGK